MTILRLNNENGNSSQIGWGKHRTKDVKWILENDPEYLRWIYYNLKAVQMKKDLCDALGLDAGIAFHKRKSTQ